MIPAQQASRIYIRKKKASDFEYGHKFENKSRKDYCYLLDSHMVFLREKLQPSKKKKTKA
jgi:hypothetical protein